MVVLNPTICSFTLICLDYFIEGKYFSKNGSMVSSWRSYMDQWNTAYKVQHGLLPSSNVQPTLPLDFLQEEDDEDSCAQGALKCPQMPYNTFIHKGTTP